MLRSLTHTPRQSATKPRVRLGAAGANLQFLQRELGQGSVIFSRMGYLLHLGLHVNPKSEVAWRIQAGNRRHCSRRAVRWGQSANDPLPISKSSCSGDSGTEKPCPQSLYSMPANWCHLGRQVTKLDLPSLKKSQKFILCLDFLKLW